ncbi:MAG: sulfotransferase [Dokdonella sp.]|uniref:sulfotransferase n=3 Tax=Dokdonella sp. TaxID=2291710 RepID=UPI001B5FFFA7|nr:sulfotransferase [Dokdonella sp.]MBK8123131.1 sulfotransferase [Dokdonella sp.]MBP6327181.1 sulfotransferase [Dokdonella sp.]MBP6329542.1 sulfotransferase [Dokdonella sp.]HQV50062.1 sulfotransferase [Dokdonella sp.]
MTESAAKPSIQSIADRLQTNQLVESESLARLLLHSEPDNINAKVLLAISLLMQGRPAEAADIHRQLIQMQPRESTHYNNLGTALHELGDLDAAEHAYRQGLLLEPDNAGALASLGSLRWQKGDAVETRDLMLAAWRLDPGMPEPRIYGASACLKCADPDMAAKLLEHCEKWPFLGATLEADLCAALIQIDRADEAERRLRSLMKHAEARSIASIRLAALMERVNRLDEAERLLAEASIAPADGREANLVRAVLASRRGHFDKAISLFLEFLSGTSNENRSADTLFALAKTYDGAGKTEAALDTLQQAHEIQMKHAGRLVPRLVEPDSNPLDILEYPVSAEAYSRWKVDPTAPSATESPIFIVGFPRSGTTLLEQMLDAHPGIRSMDERAFLQNVIGKMQEGGKLLYPDHLDRLSTSELGAMRETYWACVKGVVTLGEGERLVDKNPLNVLRLPIIHRIFPNARIILALRHPCDVLISNYMQCFTAPAYQVLCSSIERLARGYAEAMDFWTRHAKLFNASILDLRYEDLLNDLEASIHRIAKHLELPDADALRGFQNHAMAKGYISTPSYAQVVEPLNTKAVGRWQRYRTLLEPVLPVLKPAMDRWNYAA